MLDIKYCNIDISSTIVSTILSCIGDIQQSANTWICIYRGNIINDPTLEASLFATVHENHINKKRFAFGCKGEYFFNEEIPYLRQNVNILHVEGCILAHRSCFPATFRTYLQQFASSPATSIIISVLLSNWLTLHQTPLTVIFGHTEYVNSFPSQYSVQYAIEYLARARIASHFIFHSIKWSKHSLSIPLNYSHYALEQYYQIPERRKRSCPNLALFIDSRFHKSYVFLFRQISRFLPESFSIMLYVTDNVLNEYKELVKESELDIQVVLCRFPLKSRIDYNNLMLSYDFWKQFESFNRVLLFQSDTMIYKYGIESYLSYDYIGAPWPVDYAIATGVGNGGFSIRNVKATLDVLEKKAAIPDPVYERGPMDLASLGGVYPEDVYYSHAMNYLGHKVAPFEAAYTFASESCYHHSNIIGSHQLDTFSPSIFNEALVNSITPYTFIGDTMMNNHRYGWPEVRRQLGYYFTNTNSVHFYGNGEELLNTKCAHKWVGIFHTTPLNTKTYYKVCDLALNIKKSAVFIENLENCQGIFTLSEYLSSVIRKLLSAIGITEDQIPVNTLYHPVVFDNNMFNPKKIDTMKQIVFLGSQLRRQSILFKLNVPDYKKIWLPGRPVERAKGLLQDELNEYGETLTADEYNSVEILNVDNDVFDTIVNSSFLIVYQINASANNAIVEAIARNIPLFCNRLPAVEEYLGKDYPLYFETVAELEALIQNKALIKGAHTYLCSHSELKEKLTYSSFLSNILNSQITRRLLTQSITQIDRRRGQLHALSELAI